MRLTVQGAEARKRGEEEQLAQLQSEIEDNQKVEREAKRLLKEIEAELEALAPQRTATIVSLSASGSELRFRKRRLCLPRIDPKRSMTPNGGRRRLSFLSKYTVRSARLSKAGRVCSKYVFQHV